MNPNAKPFVFNPGATSWSPPETPATTSGDDNVTQPPPVPDENEKEDVLVKEMETLAVSEKEEVVDNDDDDIDENDPLWIATLKVTNGDKKAAIRMLDDPDSLMAYPEIVAIMQSESANDNVADDWENNDDVVQAVSEKESEKQDTEKEEEDATDDDVKESTATPYKPQKPGKKVVEEKEDEEEVEGDPREHMNLVFIGHVDAGKSTLSGSILYLMGKVDSRTIERFEKEAKNRNRESWFLAFIMDTSEEERAKGKTVEVSIVLYLSTCTFLCIVLYTHVVGW